MYESEIEEALVAWLPEYYGRRSTAYLAIDRQVFLPSGKRADVIVVCKSIGDDGTIYIDFDVWEVKRGNLDLASCLQVLDYLHTIEDFYTNFVFDEFVSKGLPHGRVVRSRSYLVGAGIDASPLFNAICRKYCPSCYVYKVGSSGEISFDSIHIDWPETTRESPTLARMLRNIDQVEIQK